MTKNSALGRGMGEAMGWGGYRLVMILLIIPAERTRLTAAASFMRSLVDCGTAKRSFNTRQPGDVVIG